MIPALPEYATLPPPGGSSDWCRCFPSGFGYARQDPFPATECGKQSLCSLLDLLQGQRPRWIGLAPREHHIQKRASRRTCAVPRIDMVAAEVLRQADGHLSERIVARSFVGDDRRALPA